MIKCDKCDELVSCGEEREFNARVLCEDCYIDAISSPVRKMWYDNDPSGFMLRLQDSYSAHQQQYH